MEVTKTVAKRATCDRDRSGCVITKNNRLLVTWYVGSPPGMPHCDEVWHQFRQVTYEDGSVVNHCMRNVHAEQNALCQAAKFGISLDGATLYCDSTPCRTCAMLIMSSWIQRVVCEKKSQNNIESEDLFNQSGVDLVYLNI